MLSNIVGEALWRVTVWCRCAQRAIGYRRYDSRIRMHDDLVDL